jgi:ribosomal protein S18 acetylase RimI-like enzyme
VPPDIQIRRARSEDAADVARVLYESFLEYKALYTREGFAATTPGAKQVLARMREGPVWIAVREIELLGTVAATVKKPSLYMRGMAVLPAARGLGLAARLLDQVEKWATAQKCTRVFLSTTPFLSAAIRLYESAGFRRTPEGPHNLYGTPLFTMEKIIPPKIPSC